MRRAACLQSLFNGRPELVCFDLDGTLIDSVPSIAKALNNSLREFAIAPACVSTVRGWIGHGAGRLVEQAMGWAQLDSSDYPQLFGAFLRHYEQDLIQPKFGS